jgi:5-methylcytosine-specific restriction protein A
MPTRPPYHRLKRPTADQSPRPSTAARGYDNRWRRFARHFLRLNPLCQYCAARGVTTAATEVDHVQSLAAGGEKYDPANLKPTCKPCHSRKTNAEDGGLGRAAK